MHYAWLRSVFLRFLKFIQIKVGGPNFWGEPIFQNVLIIWSPFRISILKVWWALFLCHSLDYNTFCMIQKYFSQRGDLISGRNQFCRKSELFGLPFCISISKILLTQILCHSVDLNAFCMIWGYLSQILEISANERGKPNFWWDTILQKLIII